MPPRVDSSRPLQISSRISLDRYLFLAIALLILMNALAYWAMNASREHNLAILSKTREQFAIGLGPEVEALEPTLTQQLLQMPCELGHVEQCQLSELSSEDERLRQIPLPPLAAKLVAQYQYSSAYNLLSELMMLKARSEVVEIASRPEFDLASLDAVIMEPYFLTPAKWKIDRGLEQEAISLFRDYLVVVWNHVQRGEWYSGEGLDNTDLPVLAELFCMSDNRLSEDLCLVGLLQLTISDVSPAERYAQLPGALSNSRLSTYFKVWEWDGLGQAPIPPRDMSRPQLAAWYYATGVRLRRASALAGESEGCTALTSRSVRALSRVSTYGPTVFGELAKKHIDGLRLQGATRCQRNEVASQN